MRRSERLRAFALAIALCLSAPPARAAELPAAVAGGNVGGEPAGADTAAPASASDVSGETDADGRADAITVLSWGGAYEASQRAAYFEPFTRETGIEVRVARYDGGLAALAREVADGTPAWDVVDLVVADAEAACREGLLEPFDADILSAADGVAVRDDFDRHAIGECWVAQLVFSTVVAYDVGAFPDVKPRRIADFFDVERFPGKRGLRCAPVAILEWALLAHDVPRSQVYDLLSTPRGLDLAFRQLDTIAPHIVWWNGGEEPAELLSSGTVAMTSGYNGRFFDAQVLSYAPISILWDGQLVDHATWAVPKGALRRDAADAFIRFATRPARMADQAMHISYGPTRESARRRIGRHVEADVDMSDHLPTSGERMSRAVVEDSDWYARTEALRERRFAEWLTTSGAEPCRRTAR